ncbi:hypothetical protein BMR1_02g00760 [Babesia microti strain RI]|uniref:Uncharacterized protein n=1 Tax=Babesia microti (strain RI) TaxID=1133968 RepID=I7J5Y3_BABMR|nr:hypothetical protein BMR1_02g00760 [Babesia microti strain RI]CCF73317.1 hypothetical protein BMR1_02g00760 [Babesia microti strain RI]|eukprot:XP_012647926.1 hypothetical protein BMR1_02g00760 [Babesia microti strain RI]
MNGKRNFFVKFPHPLCSNRSFHYTAKSQSLNITKDKLIKLLRESLYSRNHKRLSALILATSSKLYDILDKSLQLSTESKDGLKIDDINENDLLQTFDLLILWRSIRLTASSNSDINMLIDKLVKVTEIQLQTFPFIRLALTLHQVSQLFNYIENVYLLDNLNRELITHLSQLTDSNVDSHSLCLLLNYITNTPCTNTKHYVEMCRTFLSFMDIHSKNLTFTSLDHLLVYKNANKLYQRYKGPQAANVALKSLNSYLVTSKEVNVAQIVRLCNQLLSNFSITDLTIYHGLYKELLNHVLEILNKQQIDTNSSMTCESYKKVFNLHKRLNKLLFIGSTVQ